MRKQHFKNIYYIGDLSVKRLPKVSQFIPDYGFHSQLGDEYKIAELGDVGEFYERLGKYDCDSQKINFERAVLSISYFLDKVKDCHLLSIEDAFNDLNKLSSIGTGCNAYGIYDRNDPLFVDYLLEYMEVCSFSMNHCVINAAQKDEIRPSHKTPRLFTSYPPEHTFLSSIVLGDFLRQFYDHHFTSDLSVSAVGDSPQHGAYAFYKEELSKLPYLYCTDTSAQDSSVTTEFLELVYNMIKSKVVFPSWRHEMLFENVKLNSIYKVVNMNGILYYVPKGLGSGDYLTVVINIMWRLYMVLENYHHSVPVFFEENTVIINGDDLIMSSLYKDLDLNSRHAKIEWSGGPISWENADFCSMKFHPYIHHSPAKVLAVFRQRLQRSKQFHPASEMERCGGLLRCLANREVYDEILSKMKMLAVKYNLHKLYASMYISYEELFSLYNDYIEYHAGNFKLQPCLKMSSKQKKNQQKKIVVIEKKQKPSIPRKKKRNRRRRRPMNKEVRNQFENFPVGTHQTGGFGSRNQLTYKEDEYIGEIITPGANPQNFKVWSYGVNPGNPLVFPWLSSVATNFECYNFTHLEFYYKPEVTQYTSGANTGKIMMTFNRNADAVTPNSKQNMEDTQPHVDFMPYQEARLLIPMTLLKQTLGKFIRGQIIPNNEDPKTYDVGLLFVAIQGQSTPSLTLGELHVRYVCNCQTPVLEATALAPQNRSVLMMGFSELGNASGLWDFLTSLTFYNNTNVFGASLVAGQSLSLPPGNYMIYYVSDLISSGAYGTRFRINTYYNGNPLGPNYPQTDDSGFTAGANTITITDVQFISINTGDILTFGYWYAVSAGTPTLDGKIIIQSV